MKIKRDIIYFGSDNNILYTDAGDANGKYDNRNYKIGLYHPRINKTETIELDNGLTTYEAECYGLVNAIIYAINNELKNVMIVGDNKSACENKKILNFAKTYAIKIYWIPRELNQVADKITKIKSTTKKQNLNNLKLIYNLVMRDGNSLNT